MFEDIPLPLDWPVYVTQAQAEAYARWIGKALPTEEQFHRAAYGSPAGTESQFPWGNEPPGAATRELRLSSAGTRNLFLLLPAGDSAFGVSQLVGNGWEWTSTIFGPFPGFQPRLDLSWIFSQLLRRTSTSSSKADLRGQPRVCCGAPSATGFGRIIHMFTPPFAALKIRN